MRLFTFIAIAVLALLLGLACSKADSPMTPSQSARTQSDQTLSKPDNHHLWYYGLFSYDPATNKLEANPTAGCRGSLEMLP